MIIEVSIKNFRSIKDWQTLSLLPVPSYKEHPQNLLNVTPSFDLLKSSVIYGPNASGKSNLLRGIWAFEYLVTNSANFQLGENIPSFEPFKLDKENNNKPVELAIDFIASNNLRYYYQIAFNKKSFVYEALYFYPKNRLAKLFERKNNETIAYGEYYKGERKSIESQTLENQLFLSKASNSNVKQLKDVYLFFKEKTYSNPHIYHTFESRMRQEYAERISANQNGPFHRKFNQLISKLDTGINEIQVSEIDPDKISFPENMPDDLKEKVLNDFKYEINPLHNLYENGENIGTIPFRLDEESSGTQKLFSLGGIILQALEEGAILVIDEFEKDLHPHIVRFLIQLFNNKKINFNKAQLIFATHDITQLDNDLFRRDQVWFTEKDKFGATKLFSLSDFKGIRENTPFGKWYDSGRFSATPVIDQLAFELAYEEETEKN